MKPTTACASGKRPKSRACGEKQRSARTHLLLSARNNGWGASSVDNIRAFRKHRATVFRCLPRRLPLPRQLLLLLVLLLLQAVARADTEKKSDATASDPHAHQDGTTPSSRRLADLPDVAIDTDTDGDAAGWENEGGGHKGTPASLDEEASETGGPADAGDGGGAGGEPLTPEESAGALLADGMPRCFFGDVEEPSELEEEGGSEHPLLCLPTLFFLGVSKCGTSSLSEWMSHHPRIRWVRRPQHLYYLEAHVFDIPPDAAEWRRSAMSPSSSSSPSLRDRLAVEAQDGDTVVDYTPNYSLVAEVPYRISDVYGEGPLRERGLRFLVLLREPAARTVSSWEYKTDPDLAARVAKARYPEVLLASLAGRAVEARPLRQAVEDGMEMVSRLSACVANATAAEGGYGLGGHEVAVCDGGSATVPEAGCEDGNTRQRDQDPEGQVPAGATQEGGQKQEQALEQGPGEGCEKSACESYVEPWCNPADFLEDNLYDAHVGKSAYAFQLARWFAMFGRDKFKVVFTEDIAGDPMGMLEDVFDFLGLDLVDPEGIQGLRSREEWESIVRNRSNEADPDKKAELAAQVTPEIVKSLRDFFAPHNDALEELLGVPVPAGWRTRR